MPKVLCGGCNTKVDTSAFACAKCGMVIGYEGGIPIDQRIKAAAMSIKENQSNVAEGQAADNFGSPATANAGPPPERPSPREPVKQTSPTQDSAEFALPVGTGGYIIGGVVGGLGCAIGAGVALGEGAVIFGWFVGWLVFGFFGIAVGTFIKGGSLGNAFHNYIAALKMTGD